MILRLLSFWVVWLSLLQCSLTQELPGAFESNDDLNEDTIREYLEQFVLNNNIDEDDLEEADAHWLLLPVLITEDADYETSSGYDKRGNTLKSRIAMYRRFPGKRSRLFVGKRLSADYPTDYPNFSYMQLRHPSFKRSVDTYEKLHHHFVGKRAAPALPNDEVSEEEKRRMFVGKRRMFVGKRPDLYIPESIKRRMFVGKKDNTINELTDKRRMFVGKRSDDDIDKRRMFVGKKSDGLGQKRRMFVGKRGDEMEEENQKRRMFVGKRDDETGDLQKRRMFVGKRADETEEEFQKRRMFVGKRYDQIHEQQKRRMFVGKRDDEADEDYQKRRMFVGKRDDETDQEYQKRRMFVGKRDNEIMDGESPDKRRMFVGKRTQNELNNYRDLVATELDKRRMFVGKRNGPNFGEKRAETDDASTLDKTLLNQTR